MKSKVISLAALILLSISSITYGQTSKTSLKAKISEKTEGKIALHELIGQEIKVNDSKYTVESFTFLVIFESETIETLSKGSFIGKNISNNIRTAPNGTKVVISEIVASDSFGNTIKLPTLNFTISN